MDSVFQDLKRAREARGLSIADVSDATLINVTFLEAIEHGRTNVLPQTYVRAFIREYAAFVGLDPSDIIKRYEQETAVTTAPPMPAPAEIHPAPEIPQPPEKQADQKAEEPTQSLPSTALLSKFALPAILVIALGIITWNLLRPKEPLPNEEPRTEESLPSRHAPDSVTFSPTATEAGAVPDSLTLRAVVSDTAWVQIEIDNMKPLQYVFRPNRRIEWKAKERFRLSTGNAGAIDLTLDGKHLGMLGKRRSIVRDTVFSRRTLKAR